jgi:hypothetical protein
MPRPSHPPCFYRPNNTGRRAIQPLSSKIPKLTGVAKESKNVFEVTVGDKLISITLHVLKWAGRHFEARIQTTC